MLPRMMILQLLSRHGKTEGITGFTDKIAEKATYENVELRQDAVRPAGDQELRR